MTRRQGERIGGLCLFAAAVFCGLCWMWWLSGSLEESRFQSDVTCETATPEKDFSGDEFERLLTQQGQYRQSRMGPQSDFSHRRLKQDQADQIRSAQTRAEKDQNSGGPPMVSANLAHADLSDLDLHDIDFTHADLTCANFSNSRLDKATFDDSRINGASFQDLVSAAGARFNGAQMASADFSRANLKKSSFDRAATLSRATFANAEVSDASFSEANLTDVLWSPISTPIAAEIATAKGLETLRPVAFGKEEAPSLAGLRLLARELRKSGERQAEERVTRAYEAALTRRIWAEGNCCTLGGITNFVVALWRHFTWGALTDYALSPSRALLALVTVAIAFLPRYWVEIPFDGTPSRKLLCVGREHTIRVDGQMRDRDEVNGVQANTARQRLWIALRASVNETLNVGFGELKLAEWLGRLRRAEEEFALVGCLRRTAGFQSLIATVIFVLWAWCMFGDPFGDAGGG